MSFEISTYFSGCHLTRSGSLVVPRWTGTALVPGEFAKNPFSHVSTVATQFALVLDGHGHRREEDGLLVVEDRYDDGTGHYKLEYGSGTSPDVTATLESFGDNGHYVRVNYFGGGVAGSVLIGISGPEQQITAGQTYTPLTAMRRRRARVKPVTTEVHLSKAALLRYLGRDTETSLADTALLISARIYAENRDTIQAMQIQGSDHRWHNVGKGRLPSAAAIDPARFTMRSLDRPRKSKPYVEMEFHQDPKNPRDQVVILFGYDSTAARYIPFGPSEGAILDYFGVYQNDA